MIAILVPTRKRVFHLRLLLESLKLNTLDPASVQLVFGIDEDDKETTNFLAQHPYPEFPRTNAILPRSNNSARRYNELAARAPDATHFLILNDDSLIETQGWDTIARELAPDYYGRTRTDGFNFSSFPIIPAGPARELGYLFPPDFGGLGADPWIYHVYNAAGLVYDLPIDIRHLKVGDLTRANQHKQPIPHVLAHNAIRTLREKFGDKAQQKTSWSVCVARLTDDGWHRHEVGTWLIEVAKQCTEITEFQALDVHHCHVQRFPTDVARNNIVTICQEKNFDIVFMVDDDCKPPMGWFETATTFLIDHPGPAVIGCPYVCGGNYQEVQVFEFQTGNNDQPRVFALGKITREDAIRRTGIERVDSIGSHCIAYRVDAFDRLEPPYYHYNYDLPHCHVTETEEMACHRQMWEKEIPFYCSWDHWAGHYKQQEVGKPLPIKLPEVSRTYISAAVAEIKNAQKVA